MNIIFPSSKKILRQQIRRIKIQNPKSRTEYSALRDKKDIQQQLTEELDKELEGFIGQLIRDINRVNEIITPIVKRNVENICTTVEVTKKKEPWEDETLNQLMRRLHKFSDKTIYKGDTENHQKPMKKLKNEYYKESADNINTAAEARDAEK